MHPKLHTIILTTLTTAAAVFLFSTTANAHVTVKPAEATPASFQTFTVSVPNEKPQSTTQIKLLTPSGLEHITPTQKPGWSITTEKNAKAEISSITWSGGKISDGMRDEFTFSAKLPSAPGEIKWKAYQTYADGTVVSWDQAASDISHDEKDKGPFSVTRINETVTTGANNESSQQANSTVDTATYIAAAALIVALISLAFSTRSKS